MATALLPRLRRRRRLDRDADAGGAAVGARAVRLTGADGQERGVVRPRVGARVVAEAEPGHRLDAGAVAGVAPPEGPRGPEDGTGTDLVAVREADGVGQAVRHRHGQAG